MVSQGLSCGESCTAVVTTNGRLYFWGTLGLGPLWDAIPTPRMVVALQGKFVRQVACGAHHMAILTEAGEVFTMGTGAQYRLGHGDHGDRKQPALVEFLQGKGVRQMACGDDFTVVLTDNDSVYTWGSGDAGQLGHGGFAPQPRPKIVQSLYGKAIVQIAAGARHAACVSTDGELLAWGCGKDGRLGHGGDADIAVPMAIKGLMDERVCQVACGAAHTLALTETGRVYAWGANTFLQLGLGHALPVDRPTLVASLRDRHVQAVRCGSYLSMCLVADPEADPALAPHNRVTVLSWGCGNHGVLGHGSWEREGTPREVLRLKNKGVREVICSRDHAAALTLHVWQPDDEVDACNGCKVTFSWWWRKHHCRCCGRLYCASCSSKSTSIPTFKFFTPVRVCDGCFRMLLGKG